MFLERLLKKLARRVITSAGHETETRIAARLEENSKYLLTRISYLFESQRRLASAPTHAPHWIFRHAADDYWLWANTEGMEYVPEFREILPSLPPEYFQLLVASLVGEDTLRQAFSVYMLFRSLIEKHHRQLSQCDAILDFGCGWGRVLRFFLRDLEPGKLWGIESSVELVQHAKETNKWSNFLSVDRRPPTALPEAKFDVVFAYSVFSHLAEREQREWLAEIHRVLMPGGLLIATTWGRDRADFLESVKNGSASVWDSHYNTVVRKSYPGSEAWLRDYDSGSFCHIDLGYAGNETYGDTCIPEPYAKAEWANWFAVLEYLSDRKLCMQDVIVARRR